MIPNLKLKKLSISAFRSFTDRTEVEFPDSGLLLIRGSSGSGKTSLLLAIQNALGICPFPDKTLQSWNTEAPRSVELTLGSGEHGVGICRGKSFSVSVDGLVTSGSAKVTEAALTQALGLGPELLEALTYRKQMSRGMFLSKTDSEKKEFLTELLGLEKFEQAVERSQEAIRDLTPRLGSEFDSLDLLRLGREDFKNKNPAPDGTKDLNPELNLKIQQSVDKVAELQQDIENNKKQLADTELRIQKETDAISKGYMPKLLLLHSDLSRAEGQPVPDLRHRIEESILETRISEARAVLADAKLVDADRVREERARAAEVQGQLRAAQGRLASIDTLKSRGRECLQQKSILEGNICPTCSQQWLQAQDMAALLDKEMLSIHSDLCRLRDENLKEKILEIESELVRAWTHTPHPDIDLNQKIIDQTLAELGDLVSRGEEDIRAAIGEKQDRINELRLAIESCKNRALEAARLHQGNARESLTRVKAHIEEAESKLKVAVSEQTGYCQMSHMFQLEQERSRAIAEMNARTLKEMEDRIAQAEAQVNATRLRLAAEQDFMDLTGREGFLGLIFSEVLAEISYEANRILSGIPNVAHVTINLRAESTTQKGIVKKSITPVVCIGGHEAPLASGCSGGMFSAVELAVDIAVATIISRRTGVVPGWLILDECFEGLGVPEKEGCLEILRSYAQDKLVIIIDHSSEVKEAFTQVLDVECCNGSSQLTSR